jgi:hypothetical protein
MKTPTSISLILLSMVVVATALPSMDMRSPKLNTDPENEIYIRSLAVSDRQQGKFYGTHNLFDTRKPLLGL